MSLPTNHFEPLTTEQRDTLLAHHRGIRRASMKAYADAQVRINAIWNLAWNRSLALDHKEAELLGFDRMNDPAMPQEGLPACAGSTRRVGALGEHL